MSVTLYGDNNRSGTHSEAHLLSSNLYSCRSIFPRGLRSRGSHMENRGWVTGSGQLLLMSGLVCPYACCAC